MQCSYCNSSNSDEDHRCHTCGRRLDQAAARPAAEAQPRARRRVPAAARQAQLAPAIDPAEGAPARRTAPLQPALFSQTDVREGERFTAKVIPMESYTGPAERTWRRPARRQAPHRPAGRVHAPPDHRQQTQQTFAFQAPPPIGARDAGPTRQCDAPVAGPVHRSVATALDLGLVFSSLGVAVLLLYLSPASEFLTIAALPYLAGFGALLALGYKLLWAMAEMDSPGLRWTSLRLLNFDGAQPNRRQRIERVAGACLSLAAAGLGLLWALFDEETLSWHDHISKTFSSPVLRRTGA